jgi:hypothetical protein
MADSKISALPAATDLTDAVIPIVQSGVNKKADSGLITPEAIGAATTAQGAKADSAVQPEIVKTPSIVAEALVIDLAGEQSTVHVISLNADINAGGITAINVPTGLVYVQLVFNQATPEGTTYAIPETAFTGLGTVVFDWPLSVYQDETPTIVTMRSYDGGANWRASANSEIFPQVSSESEVSNVKIAVVTALPGSPDADTIYYVPST